MITNHMREYLNNSQEDLKQLIRDLCAIPAPSHHEEKRAAFCKEWFEKAGGQGVYIDEALNVICPHNVTDDNQLMVFMAHTDTVFPDMEPMPFVETEEIFACPGVGDDTANLAVMMICARYYLQNQVSSPTGILFIANSCEEGLGNLKGCRAIVERYGSRMDAFVTFDGFELNKIAWIAVGSHRYRVTIRTEGGHSYSKFGNRNAIHYLASMINTLYTMKVPQEGNSKTTYNVGLISGGTSVNTIAQEAEMMFEYRSDNRNCLAKMESLFHSVVETYRAMGIGVDVELVGDRPCSGDVDPVRMETLKQMSAESIRRINGLEPEFVSSSTDCNIPLSQGIPSICTGVCVTTGVHTRSETLQLSSLPKGSAYCMDFISKFYNV